MLISLCYLDEYFLYLDDSSEEDHHDRADILVCRPEHFFGKQTVQTVSQRCGGGGGEAGPWPREDTIYSGGKHGQDDLNSGN